MWIITWLLDRFERLVSILDTWFNRIIELAVYGLSWIVNKIDSIANSIINLISTVWSNLQNAIIYYYNIAVGLINSVVSWAQNTVLYYYNAAVNFINSVWSWARDTILYYYDMAVNFINSVWSWARDTILYYYDMAVNFINSVRSWAWDTILYYYRAAVDFVIAMINPLIADFIGLKALFNQFVAEWLPILRAFFDNPAAAIFACLEAFLYPWLEWWFAVLLWDTSDTPAKPNLFGAIGGRTTAVQLYPNAPPVNTLLSPTGSLEVSGFVFSPIHPGVDLQAYHAQPVYAAHDGIVTASGWNSSGLGWYIEISGSFEVVTVYGHLDCLFAREGQTVYRGQVIGFAGSSGHATGTHVHFEVYVNGQAVDPLPIIRLMEG